jgi:hypothetical protein
MAIDNSAGQGGAGTGTGQGGASGAPDTTNANGATGANEDGTGGEEQEDSFTASEVEAMIKKRVARALKNANKKDPAQLPAQQIAPASVTQPTNPIGGGQTSIDYAQLATEMLRQQGLSQQAPQTQATSPKSSSLGLKLVTASASSEAIILGVAPENVKAILKLADLSDIDVDDDGEFDVLDVKNALKATLKLYPQFGKASFTPPLKGGSSGGGGSSKADTHLDALSALVNMPKK